MRTHLVSALAVTLLCVVLSAAAQSNAKSHLFLFSDSRYVGSYGSQIAAFDTAANGKMSTISSGAAASLSAMETQLAADLLATNVNQRSDRVFIAAHGDSCAALEALADAGTLLTRVDGFVFLGCYPRTLGTGSATPRIVVVGELDGVNTMDKIVRLAEEQHELTAAQANKRGVFLIAGATNAHFADGARVVANDVDSIFAESTAAVQATIATLVVDFAGPNYLNAQEAHGPLFDALRASANAMGAAFAAAQAYDEASGCIEYQQIVLNVLPGTLPVLAYENTYDTIYTDFVYSKSNATSEGNVTVHSHIVQAEPTLTSNSKDLLACKGRTRPFFADRVYNTSEASVFGAAKDGRDVHTAEIARARESMTDAQLVRLSGSGRSIACGADVLFAQGDQWLNSSTTVVQRNANQITLVSPTLVVGWTANYTDATACKIAIGFPPNVFVPPFLLNQFCNVVFLGNRYAKFIGVKGALLLQTVTAMR